MRSDIRTVATAICLADIFSRRNELLPYTTHTIKIYMILKRHILDDLLVFGYI